MNDIRRKEHIGKHGFGIWYILRIVLPTLLTVLLVAYMFSKVDFSRVVSILGSGVDWWWIVLTMLLSVVSHIARAARWRLQLRGLGIHVPFMALCCSIFGTYALNLLFPRLGEIWRCTFVAQRGRAPFSTVLGSMVGDRLADMVMVGIIFVAAFIVATPAINAFMARYSPEFSLPGAKLLLIAAVAAAAVAACAYMLRHSKLGKSISALCRRLWEGFAIVLKMRGRGLFLLLTIGIWGCYFIQLYVAFFAFPFTKALCSDASQAWGLVPALVAFVLSSIGMAVPSNGGLGPWNLAIIFSLSLYGVGEAEGTAFSILVWSAETVILILLGIYTMIYVASTRRKNSSSTLKEAEHDHLPTSEKLS